MSRRERHRRRLVGAGVMGAVLAAVVACGGQPDEDPAPTTTTPSSAQPSQPSEPVVTALPSRSPSRYQVRTSTEACGGDPFKAAAVLPYRPTAPRYTGAGPHPAVLSKLGAIFVGPDSSQQPQLPPSWEHPGTPQDAQLVVCRHDDPAYRSRVVDTCEYAGGTEIRSPTSEVRTARYVYRVFEAATGRAPRSSPSGSTSSSTT